MTKQSVTLFAFLFSFNLISAQENPLILAQNFFEKEIPDSTIFYFEKALAKSPDNLELQQKLADIYRISNMPKKATILYELIIKSPEASFESWYNLAYVLKMNGRYEQARKILMQAKSHHEAVGNANIIDLLEYNILSCDFAIENKIKVPAFHKINNERSINSPSADFSPQFIDNQIIFASNNFDNKSDKNSDLLFICDRKNYKELISKKSFYDFETINIIEVADLSPLIFSKDKQLVICSSNSLIEGLRHPFSFQNARVFQLNFAEINTINELPKLKKLDFDNIGENIDAGFPFLSKDGKTLYFSSTGKGLDINYGGYDIYYSVFENGRWSNPVNLGPEINSHGHEISPFIDGLGTLFFSSDGHKGFGGFDIFRAEKTGDKWNDLRNLGYGVNSSQDDQYFIYDYEHEVAYFASNRDGGMGSYDLYSALKIGDLSLMPKVNEEIIIKTIEENKNSSLSKLTKDQEAKTILPSNKATNLPSVDISKELGKTDVINDTKTQNQGNLNKLPQAENVYIGVIKDAENKERLEDVWLYVKNRKTGEERKLKTSKYGEYSLILDPETDFDFNCSKVGYINFTFEINTGDGERRTLLGEREMKRVVTQNKTENTSKEPINGENFLRGPQKGIAVPKSVFQIQVGVFKNINPALIKEISKLANVIKEPYKDGQAYIYRLGNFADETHAKEVLVQVQSMMGLEKSFIKKIEPLQKNAADKMNFEILLVYPKTNLIQKQYSDSNKTEVKIVEKKDTKPEEILNNDKVEDKLEFKIQLGAFKDPNKVNLPELKDIGEIEKILMPETGLTFFYLKGYKSLDEARASLKKAKEKGIDQPFIVAFQNGKKVQLDKLKK